MAEWEGGEKLHTPSNRTFEVLKSSAPGDVEDIYLLPIAPLRY